MNRSHILAALVALALPLAAQTEPPLALKGNDPVALCEGEEIPGEPHLFVDWGRHRYRFVSEESLATFRAEPERWGIQWGGACARMGPLSGRGSPDRWAVFEGRIYVFASDACREGFLSTPKRYLPEVEAPSEADAAELERGRAMIEKAVAAHGGAEAIDAWTALRLTREETSSDWKHGLELVAAADGSVLRRSIWTPPSADQTGYDTRWVVTPDDAFSVEDGTVFDTTSRAERMDVLRYAHREPLFLLWARGRDGFRAVPAGESAVRVRVDGLSTTLHLDPGDGSITGLSWTGRLAEGLTREVTETFTDWTTSGGVRIPTSRRVVKDAGDAASEGPWEVELAAKSVAGSFRRP